MKGPDGKYLFGLVKMGEKGQIVIPKEARDVFHLHPGDQLLLLGDIKQGMALVSPDMLKLFEHLPGGLFPGGAGGEDGKTPGTGEAERDEGGELGD
ncbi:MAG: AbrB/MazE/SpoVT family DNA-binding domain-containing protein [Eubacteriales bacterium]